MTDLEPLIVNQTSPTIIRDSPGSGSGTEAAYPRFLYIELTDRCNLACPMCRSSNNVGDVLAMSVFQDIAETLFPHAKWVDLRGWGESTLLPDFVKYIDVATQYPPRLKLITNGTIRRKGLWERLAETNVLVGFSVDSADEARFARLRGSASLRTVMDTLSKAVRCYERAGQDPRESLYFCITVSRDNIAEIVDICRMGQAQGIRWFKLEPLRAPDDDPGHLQHDRAAVRMAMAALNELGWSTDVRVEYSASLLPELTNEQATRKVCIHPWDYCYINARARIGFCDHLNGREEFTWTRWGDRPFVAWWNGEQMRALRAQHLRRLSGEAITACGDCNWCYDRRYADLEHLIQPTWQHYRVLAR